MRLVIQRVNRAKVTVEDNSVAGEIAKGLFVLVGVKEGDEVRDAVFLAEKLVKLRIMADKEGKMNLSISETTNSILAVSQFTLFADTAKGNRPSFVKAAGPAPAKELYDRFVSELRNKGIKVQTGKFGEYMFIDSESDGPVTIIMDS